MKMLLALLATLAISLSAALTTASAEPRELRFAIGHPPSSFVVEGGHEYAKALEKHSNGELSARIYALSLLNMPETSPGLRDGIADIGFVLTPYFPSEFPHTNVLSESSMMLRLLGDDVVGKEGLAYIGAISEFIFMHCPECNQEFASQGQVYTGHTGGSSYGLVCNTPVYRLSDLGGKRLRVGAANWSRWSQHVGATPITMSANEMHEALSQGVVDCIVLSAPEIHNFGLMDITTDISMTAPGGIFTTAGNNVNAAAWQSLSPEQRSAMLRAGTVLAAYVPWIYHQKEVEILNQAKERGVRLHDADEALVQTTQEFIEEDMRAIAAYYARNHRVERGEEMLDTFRPILEKWIGLVQDVGSWQELADLYWDEVFSKVDVNSHGL